MTRTMVHTRTRCSFRHSAQFLIVGALCINFSAVAGRATGQQSQQAETQEGSAHGATAADARNQTVRTAQAQALRQRAAGDSDAALATLLAANKSAPGSFALLFDLSIVEDELRLYRDAERDIQEARRLRPEDLKALYAEARIKMDLQNIPAAEQDMRAYLKARPDDATAHYGLGRMLQMAQRPAEAKAEYERSIELSPGQSESYYELGQIALDSGKYDEAQQQAHKALEHNPKHGGALAVLGIAAF